LKDIDIIRGQLAKLHSLQRISSIVSTNSFTLTKSKIGQTIRLNQDNYIQELEEYKRTNKNFIKLKDNSIIGFNYIFNDKGKVLSHNLYYYKDIVDEETFLILNDEKSIEDYISHFNRELFKSIRIDYDVTGFKEYHHSKVHIHFGLDSEQIRIPVGYYLYPNEFVFMILKYIYKDSDDSLKSINKFKKGKRVFELLEKEREKFFLTIGKF
jgi:hypothetical protein